MDVCASIYIYGQLSIARTCYLLKTVMSNGIYHPYQLNESISNFWVENFNFIRTLNKVDPYQTPHSVSSGLGLYVSQKGRHAYMSYYAIKWTFKSMFGSPTLYNYNEFYNLFPFA